MNRVADVVQKGSVLGLMSLFGYQVYQIGRNVISDSQVSTKYDHKAMMQKINEKVEEEDRNKNSITTIPDRYDADDDSYLKRVPKLNKPIGRENQ